MIPKRVLFSCLCLIVIFAVIGGEFVKSRRAMSTGAGLEKNHKRPSDDYIKYQNDFIGYRYFKSLKIVYLKRTNGGP